METSAVESAGVRERPRSALDRGIAVETITWAALVWVAVMAAAVALRFAQLDVWALAQTEAQRAYDAFALFRGSPLPPGDELPLTSPLILLLQTIGFFLFGVTDATARIMPAFLGLGIVLLTLGLRPVVGGPAVFGMAMLTALSPTLVDASRTGTPAIAIGFFALLLVVATLRCGLPTMRPAGTVRWAAVAGGALGAMLASGPDALTVLLALVAGVALAGTLDRGNEQRGAVRAALHGLNRTPGALVAAAAAFLGVVILLFTRLLTDFGAIVGIGATIADWGRTMVSRPSATPVQFFLLAVLLYELLAVLFAAVAVGRGQRGGRALGWPFFAGWFGAALLLFSFASGKSPGQAVLVALPLVLLGGIGLGNLLAAVDWRDTLRGTGGLLALAILGLFVGLLAVATLWGRIGDAGQLSRGRAIAQALFVLLLVVAPLIVAVYVLTRSERRLGRPGAALQMVLLVAAVILGAFTLRSTMMLNFYAADQGTELLAQRTATGAVRPFVDQVLRLARDATLPANSIRDNTGSVSVAIAIDPSVRWPYQWYFREFPDLRITGPAGWQGAELVIGPDDAGMAEAGYTTQTYAWVNRVPPTYATPSLGDLVLDLVVPGRWYDSLRYLLFRDIETPVEPETVAVGYSQRLGARLFPDSGPFSLFDRPGAGAGRGQFSEPRGIAVAPDGNVVYVVDSGNLRVQRFGGDGQFLDIWGGAEDPNLSFATAFNQGPSGITVGSDGLVYVSDTWNHRVAVLDPNGQLVREFGEPGALVDLNNAPDPNQETGRFYGPRGVAMAGDEVYVIDTGNERVQVFASDGTFLRTFGGWGSEPGKLLEPVGIAVGPDGRVYVADSGNYRISVFDQQGTPLAQWPIPAWQNQGLLLNFLAFGPDGLLYATSPNTASVEVINPADGTIVASIRDVGGQPLQQPVGITARPDGSFLITDNSLNAVFSYAPAGQPVEEAPAAPAPATPEATPETG